MNNSSNNATAEYGIVQQTINANLQFTVQIFGFSIAAIVAIYIASLQAQNIIQNIVTLLGIHVVIWLSSIYVSRQTELLIDTETFVIAFFEANSVNFKWRQKLLQTHRKRKERNPKALFLTFVSNFSDFVAFSYYFILFVLMCYLIYIANDFKHDVIILGLTIFVIAASIALIWYLLNTLTKYTNDTYYSRRIDYWRNFKEQEELGNLEQLLDIKPLQAKLIESNGKEIFIPESAHQAIRQVIQLVASGQEVSILPQEREVTTHEAAELLNMPRPFLIKLLDEGKIPSIQAGTQRRIRRQDLMTYKKQRDIKRSELLDELIQMSQDEGLYEDKEK